VQVREGRLPRQALLEQQDRFDTYFLDSAAWASARASSRASAPHGDR
jgi:hypothetical protein